MPAEGRTNRLTLDAMLAAREPLRFTPAGLPALSMTLSHASRQPEAGHARSVDFEIAAVAFGPMADALSRMPVGASLSCEGFLARRYRSGTTLALHLTNFTLI
ncbi:MAG TPA: primosomal replication protein N [Casimicrobiaceae bacterium]|nr:primosomal replication protein N [Casimicrobiaceae bacterium]